MIGDVVGAPGRLAVARYLARTGAADPPDLVVVNAENAAAGRGVTPALAEEIFAAGAQVITLGDHVWDQKDLAGYLEREPRILRPANYPPACPGKGWVTVTTPAGPVTVISVVGRTFMPPSDCPFRAVDAILKQGVAARLVLVEIHAEATSEKIALGRYLDGRVSLVAGSHTHVQTADEMILPRGTGYLTDLGMTGARESVIGRDIPSVLKKFLTGMPSKFEIADRDLWLNGLLARLDEKTGHTVELRRIMEKMDAPDGPA